MNHNFANIIFWLQGSSSLESYIAWCSARQPANSIMEQEDHDTPAHRSSRRCVLCMGKPDEIYSALITSTFFPHMVSELVANPLPRSYAYMSWSRRCSRCNDRALIVSRMSLDKDTKASQITRNNPVCVSRPWVLRREDMGRIASFRIPSVAIPVMYACGTYKVYFSDSSISMIAA